MRWFAYFGALLLLMLLPAGTAFGQSVSSGGKTLAASKTAGLSVTGERVTVSGSGFDVEVGIYVALCVTPAPGGTPSPCGGGADLSGSSGSSVWISSNPPPYGVGLAVPFGPGGTFSVGLDVGPVIKEGTDCRVLSCAIVTRADHTRLSDRSADVVLPVTFGVVAAPTAVVTAPPAATATPPAPGATATAVSPTATVTSEPSGGTPTPVASTVSADGLSASRGTTSLKVDRVRDLDPAGDKVTATGLGFDEAWGIYVALCAVPAPGKAPGPCLSGSAETSAWISSNPPEFGRDRAKAYEAGGRFEVVLTVRAEIDANTDCRVVACAVTTRSDDTHSDDRWQDLWLPVTFRNAPASDATPTNQDAGNTGNESSNGGGGGSALLLVGAAVAVLAVAAVGAFLLLRRRHAAVALSGLAALALLLLAGCGDSNADGASVPTVGIVVGTAGEQQLPVTVQSADGRQVEVTDTSRIVSLWGNITEVVYGLGLGDSVVGRDSSATFPEVADLPLVTRGHDLSVEGVLSLNPTLVLASKDNSGPSSALNQLRNVGVPVVVLEDPQSVDDIVPRIRLIATALGVASAGEELVRLTESDLEQAKSGIPAGAESPRVAFLYMRGTVGVYLLGGPNAGADSVIRAAGGIDAGTAMGLSQAFTPISSEALAKAAPDVILMTTTGLESVGGIDGLVKIPGIAQTPAGESRRVITMEDSLLYSFGPRTPQAIETLIGALYGEMTQ